MLARALACGRFDAIIEATVSTATEEGRYGYRGPGCDGLLFPDAPWNLDGPQGLPGLRGSIRLRLRRDGFV